MSLSPYVAGIRARIGHDLLLLPTVSAAVFDAEGRILMARHTDDGRWSPIGGGLEPDEDRLRRSSAKSPRRSVWRLLSTG